MADQRHFFLEGDIVAVTHEEIDDIESMYVPGEGGFPKDYTGDITKEEIEEILDDDINGILNS